VALDRASQRQRVVAKFVADLTLWTLAAVLAFPLRRPTDWPDLAVGMGVFLATTLPIRAALIATFRLQRQTWRQVSVRDLEDLLKAIGAGTLLFFLMGLVAHGMDGFPRTVPLISGFLALSFMGGTRLVTRLIYERAGKAAATSDGTGPTRVLLVGAGSAGARMAREMRRHPSSHLVPVGFLDDDRTKSKATVSGVPVLGSVEDLPSVAAEHAPDEVLITMPSAPGRRTRRVVELAADAGVRCRILPGVTEILAGRVDVYRVRDVQVEDLLRREPIELDLSGSADYLSDRTVLVTGGGGSIGSEIVRQVARMEPAQVVLFGQGENSLHKVAQELRRELPALPNQVVVGSIRDRQKLDEVMSTFRPDVVFHAAAHKHVPMMEGDPDEAVLNNVGGTRNVCLAALAADVRRFVNVSTDKAVHPTSMLGATKHIAEKIVRALASEAGPGQAYVSVRFGNVLGSRGSVIPVFQEQIRRGGPVTLTHPDMTRYFMTIPEASRLVIQAGALAENGAVYLLDMGTPVRIQDLATDMIRLSGMEPDEIQIVHTGLRPGEKLCEELFTEEEHAVATRYDQIMVARLAEHPDGAFLEQVQTLLKASEHRDWSAMDLSLATLVPGFELGDRGSLMPSLEDAPRAG
jgi:FlaA1/EpsC-like NDP-sugar epimerase